MKTIDFKDVKTVEEFSAKAQIELEDAHGKGYCDQHKVLQKIVKRGSVYTEIGIFQGTTVATALLQRPKSVILIDINLRPFWEAFGPLFDSYCVAHNISTGLIQTDSTRLKQIENTDVLLIDSKHTYNHLKKELEICGPCVRNHILVHDTTHKPELFKAIKEFCSRGIWEVEEQNTTNVGYTLLRRI